jgi:hypothetical protein
MTRAFSALMAALLLTAGTAGAAEPKLLFHARRASMAQPCQPGITRCQDAVVLGQLYAPSGAGNYYVYLVAADIDPARGLRSIHFGINYDQVTVSGVDLFSWNPCADTQEPSAGWYQESFCSNRLNWTGEACPTDSLAVGGYFYMTCYTASFLTVAPIGDAPVTFRDCQSEEIALSQSNLGHVAFGATGGCNPCFGPCDKVATVPSSWSGIKNLTGRRP